MNRFNKFICISALALASDCALAQTVPPAIPADPVIETKVDSQLSRMPLDEKLGQMIQVEINLVTYTDPAFSIPSLMGMGKDSLSAVLQRFGLEQQYPIETLTDADGKIKWEMGYAFYNLSRQINDSLGFHLDKEKLRMAFEKYKVASILNMLGGVHAADVKTWQQATTQIQEAALKYLGIPCMYGLDQVHGTTYTLGGTLFPQPIGMAATFNPELARRMGGITAYETRACGVPWVFVPDLDLGRHPAWSRQYEGVGEDPYLGSVMGKAYLLGLQGNDPNHIDRYHVGTSLKHYVGYGVTGNGMDRNPGSVTDMELREKHFMPFRDCFRAGALSAMTNSSVLNGMNGVANRRLLTGWLKEGLNWDGMIVTDWADIENLRNRDHLAATQKEGIILAINAGVDLMMVPSEWGYGALLKEAVQEGSIPMERIDDAVRRVLRMKHRVGLFEHPVVDPSLYPDFGCESHVDVARQTAIELMVLLKNEGNILPLAKGKKIMVCGPNADTMRGLNGGWSYTWQGTGSEAFTSGYHTILEALRNKFGADNIIYEPGVQYDNRGPFESELPPQIDKAVQAARSADYIVACVGENSYAETNGNLVNLHLSPNQTELVKCLAATGNPVILVLNQGRSRLVYDIEPLVQAVVDVMLPGNYGGEALAELLAGDANFSGRLPFTYPSYPQTFTTYDHKVSEVRETMAGIYNYEAKTHAQWWFGTGLSYTSFAYSNLRLSQTEFGVGDELTVEVDVTNTGSRTGKEVVMLFSSDLYASLIPDNRRLRAFRKVELQPGETVTVTLKLSAADLAFVDEEGQWLLESGEFRLAVGSESTVIRCRETVRWRN
jgi:beta-glucosidase